MKGYLYMKGKLRAWWKSSGVHKGGIGGMYCMLVSITIVKYLAIYRS